MFHSEQELCVQVKLVKVSAADNELREAEGKDKGNDIFFMKQGHWLLYYAPTRVL